MDNKGDGHRTQDCRKELVIRLVYGNKEEKIRNI